MRHLLIVLLVISFSLFAFAAPKGGSKSSGGLKTWFVAASGGLGMPGLGELKDFRNWMSFGSDNKKLPSGLDRPLFFSGSVGYKAFDWAYVSIVYHLEEKLTDQNIAFNGLSNFTFYDAFTYNPIFLMANFPVFKMGDLFVTANGGIGYAIKYQYRVVAEPGEEFKWSANPVVFRAGASVNYLFGGSLAVGLDLHYDVVSSYLQADQTSSTPIASGQLVIKGDNLRKQYPGPSANVDMSGIRIAGGIKLFF